MLATPTPALYMESLADAAKGKVKAAERGAGQKKTTKENDDKKKEPKISEDTKSSSSDSNSALARRS